jgi:hypothetical protein
MLPQRPLDFQLYMGINPGCSLVFCGVAVFHFMHELSERAGVDGFHG